MEPKDYTVHKKRYIQFIWDHDQCYSNIFYFLNSRLLSLNLLERKQRIQRQEVEVKQQSYICHTEPFCILFSIGDYIIHLITPPTVCS